MENSSVSDQFHFDADPDPDQQIRFWDKGSGSNFFLLHFFL